jgi:uncharacterized protein DUF3313
MTSNRRSALLALALVASAVVASGCGIIRPTRGRWAEEAPHSGFLRDYSQLKPHDDYPAQEIFIAPDAEWTKYDAVYIESVTIWVADAEKAPSPEDQKKLTDMLYKSLSDKIGEKFKIAEHPGPGVLELRAAITEARGAKVVLNTVTTVIPQLRAASTILGLATDTAAFVGAASGEAELTDSVTRDRLAAAIDTRAGTKGIMRMLSKWADVEAIFDYWGEHTRDFLAKQGVQLKPGAKKD